jgi:hypothetical protein
MTAAVAWLAATERAGDRVGLVVTGDLGRCVRILERDPAGTDATRTLELAWSSVTEEVLNVRARVEGWAAVPPPIPPRTTQVRSTT